MDNKEITAILKSQGLEIAEDLAVQSVKGALELIKAMLPKVNTSLALIVVPMLSAMEPILLGLLDQIDGKDNPDY